MRRIALRFIALNIAGCATATAIVGPDGTENLLISCPAIQQCYEKAREVCGGTYKIVNSNSETSGANGYTSTETKLLVKCDR
jgi:hypothetical protein